MKRITLLIASLILLAPTLVFASTRAQDLTETLKAANIEMSVSDYKETSDQVTMYLFWGSGCEHCHAELEYLNGILDEYKDKIKLRSYETWDNKSNADLEEKLLDFFEIKKGGVPFAIIGESTFVGFGDTTGEKIKTAIDDLYETPKEERYDVFEEMEKEQEDPKSNFAIYFFGGIVVAVIIVFVVLFATKKE